MSRDYAVDRMRLADTLGVPRDEATELLISSDHAYYCRCELCKEWWRKMGPDPDTEQYGPFTKEEIDGDEKPRP